jgi:hypothetical protein
MTPKAVFAKAPEKYRTTAEELHDVISKQLGEHAVEVSSHGIIGYGKGEDGFILAGLAIRSAGVMLYASADVLTDYEDELGKKRTGKTCLRLRKLADVSSEVLADIVRRSLAKTQMNYG